MCKNLFPRKKNQADPFPLWPNQVLHVAFRHLIRPEWKSKPRQYGTKKLLQLFVENYYWDPQCEFRDQTEGRKK